MKDATKGDVLIPAYLFGMVTFLSFLGMNVLAHFPAGH